MKTVRVIAMAVFLVFISSPALAGLGYSREKTINFDYKVVGEIEIKPDKAVFPITITTNGKSYIDSLGAIRDIINEMTKELKKLDHTIFTSSPSDFFKPYDKGRKFLDVSFFSGERSRARSKLVFNIYVNFTRNHSFWQRAEFLAAAHDFIARFVIKYEKDEYATVSMEDVYYEIVNVEQYRDEIIRSIYKKAKIMADIISKEEKVKLEVRQVMFDQRIDKEILNFNRASLTINANLDFGYEKKDDAEELLNPVE